MEQQYTDLLAVRYKSHGRNKSDGFDCYGLAIEVLKRNGIELYDFWNDKEIDTSKHFQQIEKEEKYCIILIENLGNPNHIAICIDDGMMIHARNDCGVIIEPINRYLKKIRGYYKVISKSL